ncbi:hypothetical protein TNCV_1453011 [Trichonephila clavipes]|nr:hypothetical protein TNCV_1453011 [Trichonephila clavipes]
MRGHLELIWLTNFGKVRIFAGWIDQPDLQTSISYGMPDMLRGRQLHLGNPLLEPPRPENSDAEGVEPITTGTH